MAEKLYLGKMVGNKVIFKKNEFGEYEIAERIGKVELEVYYDLTSGTTEAVLNGTTVAVSSSPDALVTQLYKADIEVTESYVPSVGTIWLEEEVKVKKEELEKRAKEGARVEQEFPDEVHTSVVFKISDNVFEEVQFDYKTENCYATIEKVKYFIVKDERGKEVIRIIYKNTIARLF